VGYALSRPFTPAAGVQIPLGTPFFERGYRFFGNLFLLGVQAIPLSKRDIRGEFILSLPKEIPLGTPPNFKVRQMMTGLFYCIGLWHPAFQAGLGFEFQNFTFL